MENTLVERIVKLVDGSYFECLLPLVADPRSRHSRSNGRSSIPFVIGQPCFYGISSRISRTIRFETRLPMPSKLLLRTCEV